MEIEVGEYVRLKNGLIGKFYNIGGCFEKDNVLINFEEFSYEYTHMKKFYNDIKSHSKNIIDLIEVGDFVNGYKVDEISINAKTNEKTLLTLQLDTLLNILFHSSIGYIKSIVTHEQFESIEYKLEEDK